MILTYLKIGAAVLLIGGAFTGGYKVCDWRWKAAMLEESERQKAATKEDAERMNTVALMAEVRKDEARVVYKTITKRVDRIVDRPIYVTGVCLDADGLQLAQAAITGQAPDPGKPDPALPAPKPLVGRPRGNGS